MAKRPEPRQNEQELIAKMLSFADDPAAFVMFAFPWGKPNGPLENMTGPREWQMEVLLKMKQHIVENRHKAAHNMYPELLKIAIASGRGIGKSAMLAWIALWLFTCVPSSTVIVAANTEQQLKGTTFPEIRKWATMAIHGNWFEHHAMSLRPAPWLVDALKTTTDLDDAYWYIQARLWSEESPDAFAGVHSQRGMAVLFDEASGIPSVIWPVTQGFFTDRTTHRFWVAISNPRNPSGAFFECFHSNRESWWNKNIDARSVAENDQMLYEDIIREHGEDSDQARVEVYGQFPRQGDQQFLSRGEINDAVERTVENDPGAPLLMGVDPARFGDDEAVIAFRRGRDADVLPWQRYKRCSTTELAEHCAQAIQEYKPDGVFIEGDGVGGGVIDILKHYGYRVIEVTAGGKADNKDMYANHRTELWGRLRDWLPSASLPGNKNLADDLAAPMYIYTLKGQQQLESKDKMKKRGYASPNNADALAMTFSKTVARSDNYVSRRMRRNNVAKDMDYRVI